MGVDMSCNGTPVGERIELLPGDPVDYIVTTTRIGISKGKELRYRFFDGDNQFHHL
jgi:3-methyladenine DNA glycosylase Mpg